MYKWLTLFLGLVFVPPVFGANVRILRDNVEVTKDSRVGDVVECRDSRSFSKFEREYWECMEIKGICKELMEKAFVPSLGTEYEWNTGGKAAEDLENDLVK